MVTRRRLASSCCGSDSCPLSPAIFASDAFAFLFGKSLQNFLASNNLRFSVSHEGVPGWPCTEGLFSFFPAVKEAEILRRLKKRRLIMQACDPRVLPLKPDGCILLPCGVSGQECSLSHQLATVTECSSSPRRDVRHSQGRFAAIDYTQF